MATAARSRVRAIHPHKTTATPSREQALRKIARILEDQMTDMGLTEEEKNAKTAELVSFVSDAVASKLAPNSKPSRQPHSAGHRADSVVGV
jgi:hypothetical protein